MRKIGICSHNLLLVPLGYRLHNRFDLLGEICLYSKYTNAMALKQDGVRFTPCPIHDHKIEGVYVI